MHSSTVATGRGERGAQTRGAGDRAASAWTRRPAPWGTTGSSASRRQTHRVGDQAMGACDPNSSSGATARRAHRGTSSRAGNRAARASRPGLRRRLALRPKAASWRVEAPCRYRARVLSPGGTLARARATESARSSDGFGGSCGQPREKPTIRTEVVAGQRAALRGHEHGVSEEGAKARAGGRSGDATPGCSRDRYAGDGLFARSRTAKARGGRRRERRSRVSCDRPRAVRTWRR